MTKFLLIQSLLTYHFSLETEIFVAYEGSCLFSDTLYPCWNNLNSAWLSVLPGWHCHLMAKAASLRNSIDLATDRIHYFIQPWSRFWLRSSLLQLSLKYICSIPEIFPKYTWDIPVIYLKYTRDIPGKYLRYTRDIPEI